MITNHTALIIGAGASSEYGLPTGAQLKHQIRGLLDIRFERTGNVTGDQYILEAMRISERKIENRRDINPYLHAAWQIRDGMPQALSIDNYLDAHESDARVVLCGKLAIVRAILRAEKASTLAIAQDNENPRINFHKVENTWLNRFFQIITEKCRISDLPERFQRLHIVNFNYDRCFEHFIRDAIQNYYQVSPADAAQLASQINVYHPYGKVGNLPSEARSGAVPFGHEPHPEQLLALSEGIKTFTEGTDPDSSSIDELRGNLGRCRMYVFLGFAFHPINMALLKHQNPMGESKQVFATAHGISAFDCETIKTEISQIGMAPFEILQINNAVKCVDLFSEYWRSLALSLK